MKTRILTGTVGSGKTTCLMRWANAQPHVRGILSPVADSERYFLHYPGGEKRTMEAEADEKEVYVTPRYRFSVRSFSWAVHLLEKDIRQRPDFLLIDEIGKLELRGEGFSNILCRLLDAGKVPNLILVVRTELLEAVRIKFGISEYSEWRADPLSDSISGQW